jgi:Holliday junction resolvase RusA-like endonuclease
MKFWIDCIPPKSTHQASAIIMRNKATGKQFVGMSQSSKGKKVQQELMSLFAPHRPEKPYKGPIYLQIKWVYDWRKSETKKTRKLGRLPCDTRPDVDNICKIILDIMTRLAYWHDDSQVAQLHFSKEWGDTPGIGIGIWKAL